MDRRCSDRRIEVDVPAEIVFDGGSCVSCRVVDLSVGGARVETDARVPFGSTALLRMKLPGSTRDVVLPTVVRWTRPGVVGLQFGLLGARETHLITSLGVERAQTPSTARRARAYAIAPRNSVHASASACRMASSRK